MQSPFMNPLLPQGQDPSVAFHDGYYYLVQSDIKYHSLNIRKAATLMGLRDATPVTIFKPPRKTHYSKELWAPELLYLRGAWYIYFAADDGDNENHRTYVLRADTDDPMGTWTFMGPLFRTAALDRWSIDLVAFEFNDRLYAVWSGWEEEKGKLGNIYPQVLYIAEMSDPLTIWGERIKIVEPTEHWERSRQPIAEAPTPFIRDGRLSIVYSADASWTTQYKLGVVRLEGDNPLDPASWKKGGICFEGYNTQDGIVHGVGHNSYPLCSPDGSEWWLVYHSKTIAQDGWADRDIRIQQFTWNDDGTPHFGIPVPAGVALPSLTPAAQAIAQTEQIATPDLDMMAGSASDNAEATYADLSDIVPGRSERSA